MKRSHNRGVIYQLLRGTAAGEHLNPATVRRALVAKGHPVALSTVYSQLDVLSKAELIGETYGWRGERLFERTTEPHHHLLCRSCCKMQDLPELALQTSAEPRNAALETCFDTLEAQARALGWQVLPLRLTLTGTCPTCLPLPEQAGSASP